VELNPKYAHIGRLHKAPNTNVDPEAILARLKTVVQEGSVPCLTMPYMDELWIELLTLESYLQSFKHMIVLGIGGSALGARTLQQAFYPEQNYPNHQGRSLWIADNLNTEALAAWMAALDPKETLVVVISKSGDTVETMAHYLLLRQWLQKALPTDWAQHLFAITDAKLGYLRQEVISHKIPSLTVPDHLGGRYSVFSAVGMVPAAFLGIDWQTLLASAYAMNAPLTQDCTLSTLQAHPAWDFAVWAYTCTQQKYDKLVFFNYVPAWPSLGAWFSQLWAESLGKSGKGSMPIPALGVTDQHSLLQMFLDGPQNTACLFLHCPDLPQGDIVPDVPAQLAYLRKKTMGELLEAECLGTAAALAQAQVPLMQIKLEAANPQDAGAFMAFCMTATIFTGWLLDINPFDQPAVEFGKRIAKAHLLNTSDSCTPEDLAPYQKELEILQQFLAPKTV